MVFLLFFSGCSQKVTIKSLEPAKVERAMGIRKISVSNFSNDRFSLSNKIESGLSSIKIDNKSYFSLVSRRDFDKILQEQKLQHSGLMESKDIVDVGKFIGTEAIITGSILDASSRDSYYQEQRSRCSDLKCKSIYYYSVGCTTRVATLSADIRLVDVKLGDIIYATSITKSSESSRCSDSVYPLDSQGTMLNALSTLVAQEFVSKISPSYKTFSVELMDEPDIKYSKVAKELLANSLEYIEYSRFDKAKKLLFDLVDETSKQSYVPFYNLGVVYEAEGDYKESKYYYEMSDSVAKKRDALIDEALKRVDELIDKSKKFQNE